MAQIFRRSCNTIARVLLVGSFFGFFGFWGVVYLVYRSPYTTNVNVPIVQKVPFSHEHHYSGLGIDCRYCHTSVETLARTARHRRCRAPLGNGVDGAPSQILS